eukprot:SAG31_NODE_32_length_32319_cov_28.042681_23_plen_113_part_00
MIDVCLFNHCLVHTGCPLPHRICGVVAHASVPFELLVHFAHAGSFAYRIAAHDLQALTVHDARDRPVAVEAPRPIAITRALAALRQRLATAASVATVAAELTERRSLRDVAR